MALEKQVVLDKIEILEDGHIQVRRATYIIEDGVRIAGPDYHRVAYHPGADIPSETKLVTDVAALVWSPDVITKYLDRREEGKDN